MTTGELRSLAQRPAVVTGAGQGLGRAFAQALARTGYPVVVADIDGERSDAVTKEIAQDGGTAFPVILDVADEYSVAAMVSEVQERFGAPRALVNNAAIFSTLSMGPFTDITTDIWERVMRVNVTGTFLCCRSLVPLMTRAGYGKIINISSSTIWTGRPQYLHYVTSKAALIGFTRALAAEVGPHGVRVNAITPGSTETEVERTTISFDDRRTMAEAAALRRVQVPADTVGAVLFLAGPDSDFLTGQTLNVDGGLAFH